MDILTIRTALKKIPGLKVLVSVCRRIPFLLGIYYYRLFCLPKLLKRVRQKKVVRVAFEAYNVSMWKYHSLYKAMENDSRFEPFVVLTPSPSRNDYVREKDLQDMKRVFTNRGYKLYPKIIRYSLCFEEKLPADIIFFCQPYSFDRFSFRLKDYLYAHSSYGFSTVTNQRWCEDTILKNIAFLYATESKLSIEDSKNITIVHGKNRIYTGYVFGDELINPIDTEKIDWKLSEKNLKKIIWAPHFSIAQDHVLHLSNFLEMSSYMVDIAKKYKDVVQFAFKPHPYLFNQLCKTEGWGETKALEYYDLWRNMENTQLEDGLYANLFNSSDAIIHDCASFKVDWLYTQKPGFYVMRAESDDKINQIGNESLLCYYRGDTREDIENFITNVVLNGKDSLEEQRNKFFNKYLISPNSKSAALNIIDELSKLVWKEK